MDDAQRPAGNEPDRGSDGARPRPADAEPSADSKPPTSTERSASTERSTDTGRRASGGTAADTEKSEDLRSADVANGERVDDDEGQ